MYHLSKLSWQAGRIVRLNTAIPGSCSELLTRNIGSQLSRWDISKILSFALILLSYIQSIPVSISKIPEFSWISHFSSSLLLIQLLFYDIFYSLFLNLAILPMLWFFWLKLHRSSVNSGACPSIQVDRSINIRPQKSPSEVRDRDFQLEIAMDNFKIDVLVANNVSKLTPKPILAPGLIPSDWWFCIYIVPLTLTMALVVAWAVDSILSIPRSIFFHSNLIIFLVNSLLRCS